MTGKRSHCPPNVFAPDTQGLTVTCKRRSCPAAEPGVACAGFFKPAQAPGKKGKKDGGEQQQPPLAAAYKAALEAQILGGSAAPPARDGSALLERASLDEGKAAYDAKKVVVAWFGDDIGDLAASLAAFAPRGSQVSVVSKERPKVSAPHHVPFALPVMCIWINGDPPLMRQPTPAPQHRMVSWIYCLYSRGLS